MDPLNRVVRVMKKQVDIHQFPVPTSSLEQQHAHMHTPGSPEKSEFPLSSRDQLCMDTRCLCHRCKANDQGLNECLQCSRFQFLIAGLPRSLLRNRVTRPFLDSRLSHVIYFGSYQQNPAVS